MMMMMIEEEEKRATDNTARSTRDVARCTLSNTKALSSWRPSRRRVASQTHNNVRRPQMTTGLRRFPVSERFVIYGSFSSPLLRSAVLSTEVAVPIFRCPDRPLGESPLCVVSPLLLPLFFALWIVSLPGQAGRQAAEPFVPFHYSLQSPLSCAIYDPPSTNTDFLL